MDSPQRPKERRGYLSYFFSVRGRKEINPSPSGNFACHNFSAKHEQFLVFESDYPLCLPLLASRPKAGPLNGKHKI
jgi:hypothetical protein